MMSKWYLRYLKLVVPMSQLRQHAADRRDGVFRLVKTHLSDQPLRISILT